MALSSAADNRLLHINEAFSQQLGYTPEDVIGHTTQDIGLLVEPLFLTSPADEGWARRPGFVDRVAAAIRAGLADYLARTPLASERGGERP